MITGTGGIFSRIMPPADWNCGDIPEKCFDSSLSETQIREILYGVYLEDHKVRKLANSDCETEISRAKVALEILAEMDATTIFWLNKN